MFLNVLVHSKVFKNVPGSNGTFQNHIMLKFKKIFNQF